MIIKLTFDISILELSEEWTFEVLSTNWDTHLGWDNIDERILNYIVDEFKKEQWIDLKNDLMALQRVRDEAEKAKKELSSTTSYDINLPYITVDATWPKNLMMTITRSKFEELVVDLIEKSIEPCKKALKDAWLKASDLNEILLVGWSTRIPLVVKKVEEFFWKKPNAWINADESVAIGAAIQGWIIWWDVTDVLLLDVTPLSLSIETMWWVATKMIPRNTTIPTSKSETFSTAVDNQPWVEIHVWQGERELMSDNKSLWKFQLEWIAPAPRWVPQIEVIFDIDANGILTVKAKDKWTWKEQKITITWTGWLDKNEVEKLVKEAEIKKDEDKKRKDLIEAKNNAESTIYQSEKFVKDNSDNISNKSEIEDKTKELKDLLNSDNINDISNKTKELSDILMKSWQDLYSKQQSNDDNKSVDWVVDGEIE